MKIDEERDDDRIQIIPLTSPMKVRSPLGYRSSYNIDSSVANNLNVTSKNAPVYLSSANIKTLSHHIHHEEAPSHQHHSHHYLSHPRQQQQRLQQLHQQQQQQLQQMQQQTQQQQHEPTRKPSLLSLKTLSLSLRLLRSRGKSEGTIESTHLNPILETRKSIFGVDLFEKNLKKFVSRTNEADFQLYSEYTQQQQDAQKSSRPMIFKTQKIYARRSSMSDIHDTDVRHNVLQQQAPSHSVTNVKAEHVVKKDKSHKSVDKTAEMLKEVRKRNLETAKRISAPRRISTAY
jgi:hypothetical protein